MLTAPKACAGLGRPASIDQPRPPEDDAAIATLKKKRNIFVPTLFLGEYMKRIWIESDVPEFFKAKDAPM